MLNTMRTVEEIQAAVAARVTQLPPNVQSDILAVIDFAFEAGYKSCQRDIKVASVACGLSVRQN